MSVDPACNILRDVGSTPHAGYNRHHQDYETSLVGNLFKTTFIYPRYCVAGVDPSNVIVYGSKYEGLSVAISSRFCRGLEKFWVDEPLCWGAHLFNWGVSTTSKYKYFTSFFKISNPMAPFLPPWLPTAPKPAAVSLHREEPFFFACFPRDFCCTSTMRQCIISQKHHKNHDVLTGNEPLFYRFCAVNKRVHQMYIR